MAKVTISTYELFQMFPDQEAARDYLEGRLWPMGPKCPVCGLGERITVRTGGFYRCNQCKEDFTVRTGTIFERSHVPLHKWVYATYLLLTARKGISSMQLAKEIGITQKSAWFVLQRLREACGSDIGKLSGIIEIDETYVGGVERNKHETKKLKAGRGPVGKTAVLAMRERGGPHCRHASRERGYGQGQEGDLRSRRNRFNTGRRPATACDIVTVTVSGLTGSGKSAVCGEIEIALKAIGLVVRWPDGEEEKRLTHADWQSALDLYKPEILIQEVNIARIPPGYFGGDTLARSKP